MAHHEILIVGGGNAGISVAAQLHQKRPALDIGIVDPSENHYYQPGWTLVGGGVFSAESTRRSQADVIPKGVAWKKACVSAFIPETNRVILDTSESIEYDSLVVCPGVLLDWHKISGAREALGTSGVCSNYEYALASKTWEFLKAFRGGVDLFTQPSTPVKCAGAPQKIMYLADETFRKNGVREKTEIYFTTGGPRLFAIAEYEKTLLEVVKRKKIHLAVQHDLVEIRPVSREAVFDVTTPEGVSQKTFHYDFIHITPPMSPPEALKTSTLAHKEGAFKGWMNVDKGTLQSPLFPNVFGLGDCVGIPTSKTGAAIRKQAPTVIHNLLATLDKRSDRKIYGGYTACPLVTGYGKLVMAEFDYTNKPTPTFPLDQTKERWSMWLVKKYILPFLYWHRILPGKA